METPPSEAEARLEMLLVARWLEEGRAQDGRVTLEIDALCEELSPATERGDLLELMGAIGALEARGAVVVAWPGGVGSGTVELTLSDELRRDARRFFGD